MLKQVQETGLFKHVAAVLSSLNSCSCNKLPVGQQNELPGIAANVCCQGAEILAGNLSSSVQLCCRETCVKSLKTNGGKPVTLVSGTVIDGRSEQEVDVLVPSSQAGACGCGPSDCVGLHPAANDILTVLILALPSETWSGIKDEKLSQEVRSLVSTENLPTLLQEEVGLLLYLHLLCF